MDVAATIRNRRYYQPTARNASMENNLWKNNSIKRHASSI